MPSDEANGPSAPPPHHPHKDFVVVGIGASAGGVGALRQFFSHVPADSGMAYVVIVHLSPEHESNLSSVLQNQIAVPVTEVTGTVRVQPNHVYVIPPTKYLVMEDGIIRLAEPERPRGGHTSIDLFFRSLAQTYGESAVAIIMSGTGTDGTLGIGRIKEEGGFVIAQDPAEAEYGDMPRSAINTSLVDIVLPVAEMPAKLLALRVGEPRLPRRDEPDEEPPPREFDEGVLREILTLVRLRTGNEFQQYKRPTLMRRFERRMQVHELSDLRGYLSFLREHPEEVNALLRDLLITVTSFFRDPDSFAVLEKEVIPKLFAGKGPNDQVRVWSVGCATGEEAYSLAILLAEYRASLDDPPRVQVFATDIDDRALAQARDCRYPNTISLDVSPARLRRFFIHHDDHYQLRKELRETVLFASHNVLSDPPFSRLDLISCRNLLIYLNREMQERTLEIFHFALRGDGYLFLGGSESADMASALFTQTDPKHRIYYRRPAVGLPGTLPNLSAKWQVKLPEGQAGNTGNAVSAGRLHEEVVEQFAPPSFLINEEYDVVHMSAHAGRYLRPSGGELSRNLLKLVHPDLRLDLRAALLELKNQAEGAPVESRRIAIEIDGRKRWVNLSVRPVVGSPEAARGFMLVIFDETAEPSPPGSGAARPTPGGVEMLRQLEQELQRTKDQLRLIVEQYETSTEELRASNEELQAINEELRSATEELETSKEELQSVNEELTTVNQEYKAKIEEIALANSDLKNLMASTDIGTIFLNREMQIKLYTPPAQQLFNITPVDLGRPLQHFSHNLDHNSLIEDADGVLRTLQATEREVHSADDRWYLARLAPYRALDDKVDGVVLTFVDITNRKRSEEQLRNQAETLREHAEILNLAHVLVLDADRRVILWNAGCERLYGYTSEEALGRNAHELLKTEFLTPRFEIDAELKASGQWQGDLVHTTRAGTRIIVASHWILHQRDDDKQAVILEVNNDITARRTAEDALLEADQNKDLFLLTLSHELRNPLSAMLSSVTLLKKADVAPENAAKARDIIERQLNQVMRLVDDLLDVERLTHGRIALKKTRIELSAVVSSAIETARPLIDAQRHQLKVALPSEKVILNGDLTRLAQALTNLLHNACKYSPPGSSIELNAEVIGSDVVIRVRDSGMGIAPEMLPKLFDVYAQGQPLPGAELQGFGIGLALVRQLTEMHGGTVSATSPGVGKGSEFIVRLPIA